MVVVVVLLLVRRFIADQNVQRRHASIVHTGADDIIETLHITKDVDVEDWSSVFSQQADLDRLVDGLNLPIFEESSSTLV